jgi:hypothetical protein
MKAPRIRDFDPDAKLPTLKSSLDNMPSIVKQLPTPPPGKAPELGPDNQEQRANRPLSERPNAATPVRPNGKRIITRNSFEIYEDQMDSLRKLSYEEKMEGKLGSMSNMVREAIDNYLRKSRE